jgi:replication factor C large subunit
VYTSWTEKHKPKTLLDLVGNREAIRKLKEWVKSWDAEVPKKRAAFLYGPSGVGKTLCVEALANDLNLELVEKNASDYRTAEAIQQFAGRASQYNTLFGKKRLVMLDEMDGITGKEDKGGVKAITEITKATKCPIVLIANDVYDPRFSTLRNYCFLMKFEKPSIYEVARHLDKICKREGIVAEERALKFIADKNAGDIRSAVNDLQALAQGRKKLSYEDVAWLAERDRKEVIFNVLKTIFYSKNCLDAKKAIDATDMDSDMLFEWIYENAPFHMRDPHDLAKAMEALALADLYRGRIRSTQDWALLRYVYDFMTAGIAMSRERTKPGWVPFRFPERIRMLSWTKSERGMQSQIGMKIKKKCHISSVRAVKEILPYLKVIFDNNAEMASGLAKWLDLEEEMIEYLTENPQQP